MKLFGFILLMCVCFRLTAQQITAVWSHPRIQIGEQSRLTIRVDKASDSVIYKAWQYEIPASVLQPDASIGADGSLEILGNFQDTTLKAAANTFWEGSYLVTAWDTGVYRIQPIVLTVGDSSFTVQPENLTVTFTKRKIGDPIFEFSEDIPEDPWYYVRKYWWTVLFLIPVIVLILLRRRFRVTKRFRQLSLKERTLLAIDALEKEAFWKQDVYDRHFQEFSYILRSFLAARYNVALLQHTTTDSINLLRQKGLEQKVLERIRQLLDSSDLVKFARNQPNDDFINESLEMLRTIVIELSPLEVSNE